MCGILWSKIATHDHPLPMFQSIRHRGPDHTQYKIIDGHFLGCHRLAITNQSPHGNQPLSLQNHHLICNGQIYNYLSHNVSSDVLRTDVDIILHLFKQHDRCIDSVAKHLDGDFALVLLDACGVVHMARDPIGVRPLFYGIDENGTMMCAASEAKAIKGLCASVHVFPPGHAWDSHTNKIRRYTDLYDTIDKQPFTNEQEVYNTIRTMLYDAVRKRITNTDRTYAFLCSGGLDSSLVLAIAMDILKDASKIHAFSMQYESRGDDVFYASLLAREYGIRHTVVNFTKDDIRTYVKIIAQHIETYDPNTIRASVPMYLLAKYIKEHTDYKVFLSGEGADELFMGYNIFYSAPSEDGGKLANLETQRLIRNIHMFDGLRADRCFNAHGLEIRFPFLDIDFAKYVFQISGALKLPRNNVEKALLRNAFVHIPELQNARIIDRVKERFSDGCGFDYVPQLLRMFTNESDLESREKAEKLKYKEWFEEVFGEDSLHLITERKNPSWCSQSRESIIAF